MKTVDEPESPAFSPDGTHDRVRGAARRRRRHLHGRPRDARQITNLTNDAFADYAPTYSPDGKFIVYIARVSGNEKLFRLDLDTKKKTQLTFGTHDETGGAVHRRPHARLLVDGHRSGRAARARSRAQRQHLQHLDARPEERRAAAVHRRARRQLVAGRAATRATTQPRSRSSATTRASTAAHARAEGAAAHGGVAPTSARPGPIIDFQAPLQHTLVPDNKRKKGTFEKMFLEGRPPVNVGVTSSGDIFGGTAGHLRRRARRQAVQPLRRVDLAVPHAVAVVRQPRRGASSTRCRAISQTQFFYGQLGGVLLRPVVRAVHQPRPARSRRARCAAARVFGIYPFNRYRRVELSGGLVQLQRVVQRPGAAGSTREQYQQQQSTAQPAVPQRHADAARRRRSCRRRRSSASSARWPAARCGWPTTSRRRSAARCRGRRSTPTRATTCASAAPACWRMRVRGFKSMGDFPDFTLLRRQLRDARLRLPAVRRAERRVRERRAALPAHRGDADADRRARRHPRRVLRQHRRRLVQRQPPDCVADRRSRFKFTTRKPSLHADHRLSTSIIGVVADMATPIHRPRRPTSPVSAWWTDARRTASDSRPSRSASRSTSTGRGGRCSTRTGRTCSSPPTAAASSSASRGSRSGSATTSNEIRSAECGVRSEGPHSGYSAPRSAFRVQLRTPSAEFEVQLRTPHSEFRVRSSAPHSALRTPNLFLVVGAVLRRVVLPLVRHFLEPRRSLRPGRPERTRRSRCTRRGGCRASSAAANSGSSLRGWMQSTGHTSTHAVSFVPMQGSVMMYTIGTMPPFAVMSAAPRVERLE